LIADNNTQIRRIFADPISTDLFYGTDSICRSIFGQLQNDQAFREAVDRGVRDLIINVAEATGCTAVGDANAAIADMDAPLKQGVQFPAPFPGEIGFKTARGLASERAVRAIYEISRVLQIIGSSESKRIIEIGPGVGRSALYGHRAGLDYTTVDLPLGIVAQACFLGAVLGADHLWFEGEDENTSRGCIKILSRLPDRLFDVALNADSLVEMSPRVAIDYALWLKDHVLIFLSINHTLNMFTVAQIFGFTGAGNCQKRMPCPMWLGYREELYTMRPAISPLMPLRVFALRAFISLRTRLRTFKRGTRDNAVVR
jgi:hypothetical protein